MEPDPIYYKTSRPDYQAKIKQSNEELARTLAMVKPTCPRCGADPPDNAKFCPACGKALPPPKPEPNGHKDLPPVLTPADIAKLLHVGQSRVYEMLNQGIMPGLKLGRRWRVSTRKFFEWLETAG